MTFVIGIYTTRSERFRTQTNNQQFQYVWWRSTVAKKFARYRARFTASRKDRFHFLRRTMINVDTFSPKSRLVQHQNVKIVEIFSPRPLFRNSAKPIVKLDLIYTHPIDHHRISSISYPHQCLFAPFCLGWGKNARRKLGIQCLTKQYMDKALILNFFLDTRSRNKYNFLCQENIVYGRCCCGYSHARILYYLHGQICRRLRLQD